MISLQTLFFLLLVTFGHSYPRHHHLHSSHSLLTDKASLLEFKRTVISDPHSSLANWDEAVHVCNFTGVECDKFHGRVIQLILYDKGLVGLLSPILSNLTGLHSLEIVRSHLFGIIPPEFSNLRRLHHLILEGNTLHGSIPESFSKLSKLNILVIKENNISGSLPSSIFSNCTMLDVVDFSSNSLTGQIPEEIGKSPGLWSINFYDNQFTGQLPLSLTNLSLQNLDVEYNYLSGELPTEFVSSWPHLLYLHLSYNNMVSHDNNTNLDPLFTALRNNSNLEELELAGMDLGGRFTNTVAGQLTSLRTLLLQENQIFGSIPRSLANLSRLFILNLTSNLLNGTISNDIFRLPKLEQLFLSHNLFKISIPEAIGKCRDLGLLDLSHNQFTGRIPDSLGDLVRLSSLFLNNNLLSGPIPPTLGQCTNLYRLDLSHNRLTGNIPLELIGLHEIRIFINVSHNHLEGPLPIELSKLEKVQEIDLSSNYLTGSMFPQIAGCIAVSVINFSNNFLQGDIPQSLGDLRNLESFDVSRNQLSGLIPTTLSKIDTLIFLNLSFNNLEGKIPSGGIFNSVSNLSFLGNQKLCGTIAGMPLCSQRRKWFHTRSLLVIFIVVIFISTLLSIICFVIGCKRLKVIIWSQKTEARKNEARPELISNFPRITYNELSHATGGFDNQGLVGSEKVVDPALVTALRDQSQEVRKMWEVSIAELIELGLICTQESPSTRPTMLDAADDLDRLKKYLNGDTTGTFASSLGISSSTIGDECSEHTVANASPSKSHIVQTQDPRNMESLTKAEAKYDVSPGSRAQRGKGSYGGEDVNHRPTHNSAASLLPCISTLSVVDLTLVLVFSFYMC
ncbi:hypothetical protein Fmac_020116 [Flemingia macrophylla]|uniref:non-specific serine/threonine protein kinase n=1 Tax=Flemingia macrophylla TaxID=520843 RepID=A0ABD1M9Q8_9FABA